MRLDLTYADVVLVRFGQQILHGTIDILHKCRMQRHGITFQNTSAVWKKKIIIKKETKVKCVWPGLANGTIVEITCTRAKGRADSDCCSLGHRNGCEDI